MYKRQGPQTVGVPAPRPLRRDAERNRERILTAARELFVEHGLSVGVDEIARRAGVGMGTLYRRFPKRSDLVAGVFRREVDACAAEAASLAAQYPPGDALARWLKRYSAFLATKKGLAAALHSGDPAFDALPHYFRASFEPGLTALLDAAVSAGEARGAIEPYDLLRAIGNLSVAAGDDGAAHTQRMLDLLIDGLRYGARAPRSD